MTHVAAEQQSRLTYTQAVSNAAQEVIQSVQEAMGVLEIIQSRIKPIADMDELKQMTILFRFVDEVNDAIDALKKFSNSIKEELSRKVLPEGMELLECPNLTIDGIGRLQKAQRISASFTDPALGMNWLREIGEEALIQETVNHQTLSSFIRNMMEETATEPPEFVKVSRMTYATIRKAK